MLKEEVIEAISDHPKNKSILIVTDSRQYYTFTRDITCEDHEIIFDWCEVMYESIRYIGDYKRIDKVWPRWGSDPEFFYLKGGKVIPSKKVIPPVTEHVVRDGFQGELNPEANSCRQVSGSFIFFALREAQQYADEAGAVLSYKVGVNVDNETFYDLPISERRFGCSPTANVHENTKRVTGTRTRFRSGGGHVHIGAQKVKEMYEDDPKKVISLMDIICGVGCVLIDRDPANIERRKHYGRAGEHRVKSYGLEYRVPSNFWLQHYTLWSMVTVMLRNALDVANDDKISKLVLDTINITDVRNAINNNDKALAMKVFKQYAEIIKDNKITFGSGLGFERIDDFIEWAANDNPISMLPGIETPLETWESHREAEDVPGLESFLAGDY